jgi:uncharacterized protein
MDNLVERELLRPLIEHLSEKEITVLLGARQTGKTTLLNQLITYLKIEKHIKPAQILFYNLDHFEDFEKIASQTDLIHHLQEKIPLDGFQYVIIDEAHRLPEAGRYLKGIYDLGLPVKMIISGSRSLEINQKTSEPLTGRKRIFTLYSFSFQEWLSYKSPDLYPYLKIKGCSKITVEKIKEFFFQYLIFGGYPRIVLAENEEDRILLMSDIYSSYLEKDIIQYQGIKNSIGFSRLISLMSEQVGGLINIEEISKVLRMDRRTIDRYLLTLEETYVIKLLRPFTGSVRSEIVKMPKVFFEDNGLRNYTIRDFSPYKNNRDKGKLLENFVFCELNRKWVDSLYFWRTKDNAEVDFVVRDFYGNSVPIEVKSNFLDKPEISKSFHSFLNAYQPKKAYLVNMALCQNIIVDSTEVHFVLPWQISSIL